MDLTRCQPFITKYYLENVLSTLAGREYDRTRIKDNRNPYVFFRAVPRRSRFTYEDKRIRETKREDVGGRRCILVHYRNTICKNKEIELLKEK